jgi:type I restriction enzyme M protein
MLDTATKKRIDDCRDILVGKVPDPKSQVEQITIALIYKFMDDMDAEAEELGGQRSFFTGEYARFGWPQLMAPGMGGFEVLALYSAAIQSMRLNPGVPELFRDIFKNAYLPYRDPETLKSFLKEINGFSYDHSERLGDAFEYLLSVLGSQGDAGQFRTPRHIIDFMVEVLAPQKSDTILDPACGTAGFLISAWKHILKANTSANAKNPGDLLKPDERARLASAIKGYDISPDMVRLSLVNLYLHGFADPHIVEYDTLTQDDKWNELADVILANPPFMSPKGGIKPHKRFSVQATRSEVLFVDYMAEHLTATGRAAIVVPEGIIFQSGTAYKALRKMLVESSLVAVVSLPAGVFNPYSGVKTSILLLDKCVHKQTGSVLFVKVQNDGFNLGAQRRAVANSDLPEAARLLRSWITAPSAFEGGGVMAQAVARSRIGEGGDFNLSGERYIAAVVSQTEYELVQLADVCEVNPRKAELDDLPEQTRVSFVPMKYLAENSSTFVPQEERFLDEVRQGAYTYFRDGDVLVAKVTPCFENGKAGIARNLLNGVGFGSSEYYVLRPSARLLPDFLYHYVTSPQFKAVAVPAMTGTGGLQRVPKGLVEGFKIPLPPLEVQQQIVTEIEGYQKVIDGARQVLDSYKVQWPVHPEWALVRLSEITECVSDGDHQAPPKSESGVPFVTISNIDDQNRLDFSKTFFVPKDYFDQLGATRRPRRNDTLYSVTGSFGIPVFVDSDQDFCFQRHIALIRPSALVDANYLYLSMASPAAFKQAEQTATGAAQKTVSLGSLRNFLIPLPDLPTQRAIVAEIEVEQALVNANRELIRRMEAKIKAAIDRVWGSEAQCSVAVPALATADTETPTVMRCVTNSTSPE